ncbi:cadherin domain-containing protein [Microvirga rosea]|uniref:cadherin domain-containing protein n=1 Tax=Microvirga rosea TaxID=2715425 RepID=UPI001D0B651B|nr:cadherin domain-containing protein [Microvirga rosea]MCB8819167.1 cadherin domain-containing protein [Microvirga rosea]
MTNYFFDAAHPLLPQGANALLELPDSGTAFIGLDVVTTTGAALLAQNKQRITIAEGFKVQGQTFAVALKGNGSSVFNEGAIVSDTGTAIRFAGGGLGFLMNAGSITGVNGIELIKDTALTTADTLEIYNTGTIATSELAILAGIGADHVTNAGEIKTTSTNLAGTIIDLGAGSDIYDGTQGSVIGRIELGTGDDTAYGGTGADWISGGSGSNYIDGGAGVDTVDYAFATQGVSLSLGNANLQYTGFQFDQVLNVENIAGSAHADKLTGSDGANKLEGFGENDTLEGGFGNDILDGGEGLDTARYSGSSPVTVTLAVNGPQDTGIYGSDTLIGIENLEGGTGADKLTGNDLNNTLMGGAGNDTLKGGLGNDFLDGGSGDDRAVYTGNSSAYTITPGTESGTFKIVGPDGEDVLKDVRVVEFADKTVALVNGAPTSILLAGSSVLESAGPGTEIGTLFGSDPDGDTLTYSLVSNAGGLFRLDGSDLILNGTLDYETAKQHAITVRAADPYGKELYKTITINVRNVVETTPLSLRGTAAKDALVGEGGNDRILGLGGDDTLWGEAGRDTLIGGAGNDALIGGLGKDVFVFDTKPNVRTNVDTLYGFAPVDDTIQLSRKIFSKLPKKGTLSKSAFWTGDHVHDASDRIVYNKKTGALFYDPDGTGKAAAIQIAVLPTKLKMSHLDFVVI